MKNILTAQDVLNDIEFELVQGAISKDELGRGVAQVKEYQNKLRSELFQPGQKTPDWQEVAAHQFQLNDMLLTLLQEMAAAHQERTVQARRQAERPSPPPALPTTHSVPADDHLWRDTADIEAALSDNLEIRLDPRPTNIPIVGALFHRLKHEIHNLVIYYLQKLAERQTAVNRTYGRWLLHFDALHRYQDQQIQTQLAELERRVTAVENNTNSQNKQ
ncbi:MAG: hypothetical protein H6658_12810 [Ardenticatenaceae bacterium]|nr:hypothetical protein [Ardenticatenaceae bacterium]